MLSHLVRINAVAFLNSVGFFMKDFLGTWKLVKILDFKTCLRQTPFSMQLVYSYSLKNIVDSSMNCLHSMCLSNFPKRQSGAHSFEFAIRISVYLSRFDRNTHNELFDLTYCGILEK